MPDKYVRKNASGLLMVLITGRHCGGVNSN